MRNERQRLEELERQRLEELDRNEEKEELRAKLDKKLKKEAKNLKENEFDAGDINDLLRLTHCIIAKLSLFGRDIKNIDDRLDNIEDAILKLTTTLGDVEDAIPKLETTLRDVRVTFNTALEKASEEEDGGYYS